MAFKTIEGLHAAFLKVIAKLLEAEGKAVSVTVVGQLLKKYTYRKRQTQKQLATDITDNRNAQFESIKTLKNSYSR